MAIAGLGEVAERVRRYTVLVQPGGRGSGSGVIWNSDGTIITNAHVARGSRVEVTLWDGREFTAQVSARDSRRDLAALRIPSSNFDCAVAADSSRVRAGEVAIAVGNPFGFLGAMTMGVVHAVAPLRGLGGRKWVQADVRLAPGNSGGPLADVHGRVIGHQHDDCRTTCVSDSKQRGRAIPDGGNRRALAGSECKSGANLETE